MGSVLKTKILELRREGLKYSEIAKQLRCSKALISFHCSKVMPKENKYTEEKIKEYQAYYDLYRSITKTAGHFNVGRTSLAKRLEKRDKKITFTKEKRVEYKTKYYNKVKMLAVNYKGGKCEICGYNKCVKALEFHHSDPKKKSYTISRRSKSFETIKTELDKCLLLCANCHRELHADLHTQKISNLKANFDNN